MVDIMISLQSLLGYMIVYTKMAKPTSRNRSMIAVHVYLTCSIHYFIYTAVSNYILHDTHKLDKSKKILAFTHFNIGQ